MTDNEIIIEAEQLDGLSGKWFCERCQCEVPSSQVAYDETHSDENECGGRCGSKPYLTSRDAIIPVILKLDPTTQVFFIACLYEELSLHEPSFEKEARPNDFILKCVCATARQLTISVVKATGRFKN